jgi:hypothetical protein
VGPCVHVCVMLFNKLVGVKNGKVGTTKFKWDQEGRKGVKWGQVRLSNVKWGLVGNIVRGLEFGFSRMDQHCLK